MRIQPHISISLRKTLVYLLVGFSLGIIALITLRHGYLPAIIFAITPFLCYFSIQLLKRPVIAFLCVIVFNYFIMGLTRYLPGLPAGVITDGLLLLIILVFLLRTLDGSVDASGSHNPLTLLSAVWLLYCVLLVFNPITSFPDWAAGVRGLALYLFLFPLLTAILLNQYKQLKVFLFIWSVLTLIAISKALMQKFVGFDPAERYWLYVLGGSTTHIIYTGIRYFSFFTDAASFGSAMGMSMVVFSVAAIYMRSSRLRYYYLAVALLACYGMMISGTRAAIAVPFAGYAFYIILSKEWKIIIPGLILIICAFVFFKFTFIGHGNTEIRRMRSAFNVTRDASFEARKSNQAEMRIFMKEHPFGIGIGKAKRAEPGDFMYELPTDSSLVYIWVETGVVGLILFLSIFLITFVRGTYDVWFRIGDRQLRGIISALLSGVGGMIVCAYGNETLQQFPNGPIVYICMTFIFLGRNLDKALSDERAD